MTLPYDPRRFRHSSRYLADGRLRPLPDVVLANGITLSGKSDDPLKASPALIEGDDDRETR